MAECILLSSDSGADFDAITATASDIVAPKATLDKDGNPVTGTIVDRGNWSGSVGMNSSVIIPDGKHGGGGKINGPMVTQRGNWTGRIGVNGRMPIPEGYHAGGGYVDQWINDFRGVPKPINNVRISNGRFEVAVDEGYYGCYWAGNSYEYLSYEQVLNAIGLTASKIKKGETVLGRKGTFEGWVPEPTDLYLRGNNTAGFDKEYAGDTINFHTGMMSFKGDNASNNGIITSNNYNLSGYTRIEIECKYRELYYNTTKWYVSCFVNGKRVYMYNEGENWLTRNTTNTFTEVLTFSNIPQATSKIAIRNYSGAGGSDLDIFRISIK